MNRISQQFPLTFTSARTVPRRAQSGLARAADVSAVAPAPVQEERAPAAVAINLQSGFAFLWLLTFAIYARPEDMFPAVAPLHLTLVFGSCATLICATALLFRRTFIPWTTETKLVLLLSCWFAAGVPFAFWKSGSLDVLTHVWAKTVLVYLLLTLTLRTLERVQSLLWAIMLSELLATAFSIFEPSKAFWVGERIYGANAGFLGWNFLGIAAAMSIPYIAAIFVIRRSLVSTCLLIATSLSMMWMLILTASRGGFLNVIFSIALTSWLVLRSSLRGRMAAIGLGLVLLIAVLSAPPVFWDRLGTVWNGSETPMYTAHRGSGLEQLAAEESTEGRVELLSRSIQYTIEHPVFGLGLGNFNLASGAQHSAEPNAWMGTHNTFTQISSEAGIPALALYLILLVKAVRSMNHVRRAASQTPNARELSLMASATLVSLLSFAFGACVAHLGYDYYLFYIVAISVALEGIAREYATPTDAAARPRLVPLLAV
jgi:putative inorganic carbon (hco3(-)) transporter